ncbi:MAG: hypothetical protein AB9866_15005 [Syntrophobacteraceae bacterium]
MHIVLHDPGQGVLLTLDKHEFHLDPTLREKTFLYTHVKRQIVDITGIDDLDYLQFLAVALGRCPLRCN